MRMPRLTDSLAGRVEIATLWPLSQSELAGSQVRLIDALFAPRSDLGPRPGDGGIGPSDLLDRVVAGGYPEPLARPPGERRDAWFGSYLTTILDRDVRDLADVADLTDLPRLLTLLATRVGGLLNYADLSRSLSIPATTLKRYFALLETTFLVVTLPAWSGNLGLRLSKSPKVLLADTGLACHLLGVDQDRLASADQLRGSLLENFVAMEIVKQASWSRTLPKLLHFRTAAGREADLVLESRAGAVVGIEVKATASPGPSDFAGLTALRQAAGERFVRGVLFHTGSQAVGFGPELLALPISRLWSPLPADPAAG
jgi:predicted AAA+ superfamily ATPase